MTRIKTRRDLLIFRPFDREISIIGAPEGPSLLLRKLRGEKIDWKAVEEKHVPMATCRGPCMSLREKKDFDAREWGNKDDPHCKACIARLKSEGKTHRCKTCRTWYPREEFPTSNPNLEKFNYLFCLQEECRTSNVRPVRR